jgi:diaminohydroxyphosphoribosylaminopyrimidine deaminase/5-amino-6-(5-phosphoribosylamino)uracil reductase
VDASPERRDALLAVGVEIAPCPLDAAGRLDLRAALQILAERGITRVFSEGGPRIGASLIAQGLADEMLLFASEKPLGRKGVEALSPEARAILADPGAYRVLAQGLLGADSFTHYERR